ncbi:hypothetical protein EMO55_26515 [Escherichia coli]|nr:hypothetical protein [Escherichia coli]EEX2907328.1 hypothetical protein [Escherichia coli]EFA5242761.1 hypothetical protein [Escherichia coli]EFH8713282.1 hypothetical protein [Escherichia coli]EFN9537397.1 hypothetical protein [Escherichia coli]
MQLNVDKQNSPSVRRVLREKQGSMTGQKADDGAVSCVWCCFFCAFPGFRRADASGAGRIIQRRSLSGGRCGQATVIAVT